jgi:hypothetical protein
LLAYSWNNRLAVLRVIDGGVDDGRGLASQMIRQRTAQVTFIYVNEWRGPCNIVAISWVTRKMLMLYTNEDEVLIFDRVTNQVTERCDLRATRLVCSNRLALSDPSIPHDDHSDTDFELSYDQSIRSHQGSLFLLGVDQLLVGTPLTWSDRIDIYEQNGELIKAIETGVAFIKGTPGLCMVGLPEDDLQRRVVVGARLMQLMRKAIEIAFAIEDVATRHPGSCLALARACIDASLTIGIDAFLFEEVYEKFTEHHCTHFFLNGLARAVRRQQVSLLPPTIAQDLMAYLRNNPKALERCLLRLDLSTLDLDAVTAICRQEDLWDALIWIWTRAVRDWISPVVELIQKAYALSTKSERRTRDLLSKLLGYVEHTLLGRWFPSGQKMNADISLEAKRTMYHLIFSPCCIRWPEDTGRFITTAGIIDVNEPDKHQAYPYASLLLDYDAKRFLTTLDQVLDDDTLMHTDNDTPNPISRQALVEALINSVSPYARNNFTSASATHVCAFVARNLHRHIRHIQLDSATLHAVLVRLTQDTASESRDERQDAVQQLLKVYVPEDGQRMIELYERAGFFRVLETVYRNEHQYGRIVETYLRDPDRRHQVFDCIRKLLSDKSHSTEKSGLLKRKRAQVRESVMELMPLLVRVDGAQASRLVTDLFDSQHTKVVAKLEPDNGLVYAYLHGLFETHRRLKRRYERRRMRGAQDLTFVSTPGASSSTAPIQPGFPDLQRRYVELLCARNPTAVCAFLREHADDGDWFYNVLPMCRYYQVTDAVVWILERSGDLAEALQAILDKMQERVAEVIHQLYGTESSYPLKPEGIDVGWTFDNATSMDVYRSVDAIVTHLRMAVQLCERVSTRVLTAENDTIRRQLEQQSEDLWFTLLVHFVDVYHSLSKVAADIGHQDAAIMLRPSNTPGTTDPSRDTGGAERADHLVRDGLRESLDQLLHASASSGVSLPGLLLRLVQLNGNAGREDQPTAASTKSTQTMDQAPRLFADLRDVFFGMLDLYKFEAQLRRVAHRLIESDVFNEMRLAAYARGHGWRAANNDCCRCGRRLWLDVHNARMRVRVDAMVVFTPVRLPNSTRTTPSAQHSVSDHASRPRAVSLYEESLPTTSGDRKGKAPAAEQEDPSLQMTTLPADTDHTTSPLPPTPDTAADAVVFRCGHAFHRRCLDQPTEHEAEQAPADSDDQEAAQTSPPASHGFICIICHPPPRSAHRRLKSLAN